MREWHTYALLHRAEYTCTYILLGYVYHRKIIIHTQMITVITFQVTDNHALQWMIFKQNHENLHHLMIMRNKPELNILLEIIHWRRVSLTFYPMEPKQKSTWPLRISHYFHAVSACMNSQFCFKQKTREDQLFTYTWSNIHQNSNSNDDNTYWYMHWERLLYIWLLVESWYSVT